MARLMGIAVRPPGERAMQEVAQAQITPAEGLIGDKRSRPGRRQACIVLPKSNSDKNALFFWPGY